MVEILSIFTVTFDNFDMILVSLEAQDLYESTHITFNTDSHTKPSKSTEKDREIMELPARRSNTISKTCAKDYSNILKNKKGVGKKLPKIGV